MQDSRTTCLALQVRSIGKRDCGNLFKLGDDMIQFGGLHALLAASVADMLPVNVGLLLSEDAKRQSRAATAKRAASGALPHDDGHGAAVKSFEGLMNSPWKVRRRAQCLYSCSPSCLRSLGPPGSCGLSWLGCQALGSLRKPPWNVCQCAKRLDHLPRHASERCWP